MEAVINSEVSLNDRILSLEPTREIDTEFQDYITKLTLGDFSLSYSSVRAFAKSPLHFLKYKTGTHAVTPAMVFSRLVHLLVLEPHKFFKKYEILTKAEGFEESTWAKKENKDRKAEVYAVAASQNKEVIELENLEKALIMKEAILSNSMAGALVRGCDKFELRTEREWNKLLWKGVIDGKAPNYLIDVKSVPDANPSKLRWKQRDDKWHWQAYLYMRMVRMPITEGYYFYNICYDPQGSVSVVRQTWMDMSLAKAELLEVCEKFTDCIISEEWNYSYEFYSEQGYFESSEL